MEPRLKEGIVRSSENL